MGFAELVIGPAGGGTRWLNPSHDRAPIAPRTWISSARELR
jgi:hypothetical protein